MSNPGESDLTPIRSARQLAEWFAAGSKPRGDWRIGTEHEKFGFRRDGLAPPPYEPGGIRAMLEGLMAFGWEPILDRGNPIGLKRGEASVSLEPGGQFELSGAPLATMHEAAAELADHLREVSAVAAGSALDHPIMAAIQAELDSEFSHAAGGSWLQVMSFTDARFLRPAGVPAYGFSPFPFFVTDTLRIGDPDEHVSLDGFVRGVEIYRRVVERLVF